MINVPFIEIPVIALLSYLFLFTALMASKKNRMIKAFMNLLIIFIIWALGCICMRLQLFPGIQFWFDVSIFGLLTMALFIYHFFYAFVDYKAPIIKGVWTAGTLAIVLINQFTHAFLSYPQISVNEAGQVRYWYNLDALAAVPILFAVAVFVSIFFMIRNKLRENTISLYQLKPLFIGIVILVIGNVATVLPQNKFPTDTLVGIINAGFMFFALYKRRLFKLSLLVSRGALYIIASVITGVSFIYLVNPLEQAVKTFFPSLSAYSTLIVALFFAGAVILCYRLIKYVIDRLFIKEELMQSFLMKSFSSTISKSLRVDDILDALLKVIQEAMNTEQLCVFLYDGEADAYKMAKTSSILADRTITLSKDHPCLRYFDTHGECMMVHEFMRTSFYKSMWEEEKQALSSLRAQVIVPLKYDDTLTGIVVLSERARKEAYHYQELSFLDSVSSVVSIAIKNAKMYEQVYLEARIDDLTKLINRKYFFQILEEEAAKSGDKLLSLAILDLDDFSLYNELYGNEEGDKALAAVGAILDGTVGEKGFAARYSGKVFALILPDTDSRSAIALCENIRQQISSMHMSAGNGPLLRSITASIGVCTYPVAAVSAKQLISHAEMAVYRVKRSGKNGLRLYTVDHADQPGKIGEKDKEHCEDVYEEYLPTIYALTAAIDAKDHYTFSHSQNVANYATILAKEIGLNDDHIEIIREAALLHDIGKIGVPESILNKPGRLTDGEREIMNNHVENSISMIRHLPSLDYVIPAVIGHHERWDGKGYPRKLSGMDIPVGARCLALADCFDAMTAKRPYKNALSVDFAVGEIEKGAGTQFDPKLAPIFIELVKSGKIQVSA